MNLQVTPQFNGLLSKCQQIGTFFMCFLSLAEDIGTIKHCKCYLIGSEGRLLGGKP